MQSTGENLKVIAMSPTTLTKFNGAKIISVRTFPKPVMVQTQGVWSAREMKKKPILLRRNTEEIVKLLMLVVSTVFAQNS